MPEMTVDADRMLALAGALISAGLCSERAVFPEELRDHVNEALRQMPGLPVTQAFTLWKQCYVKSVDDGLFYISNCGGTDHVSPSSAQTIFEDGFNAGVRFAEGRTERKP